jgi:hypothetical protein
MEQSAAPPFPGHGHYWAIVLSKKRLGSGTGKDASLAAWWLDRYVDDSYWAISFCWKKILLAALLPTAFLPVDAQK